MNRSKALLLAVMLAATAPLLQAAGLRSPGMEPQQLYQRLSESPPPLVVDVRSPGEYSSGHVPGAVNIPAPKVMDHRQEIDDAGENAVLYCNNLQFTKVAEQLLMRGGVKRFSHLEGGLKAWQDQGLPLETSLP